MSELIKHTDDDHPRELAQAQIIYSNWPESIKAELKEAEWHYMRADLPLWVRGVLYTPVFDEALTPYCSREGLENDTRYVAVEECEIGGKRVLQFKNRPRRVKPSLISPERWSDGSGNGRIDAPETHRKPGDPAHSLMRVWLE